MKLIIRGGINQPFFLKIMLLISMTFLLLGNNLFDRKVLFLNFVALLLFNLKNLSSIVYRLSKSLPMIMVLSWCLLSAAWSNWQWASIEESLIQCMLFLTCLLIANTYSLKTIFKLLKHAAIITIIINVLYSILFTSNAFSSAGMTGFYNHKNNLGLIMALCSIILYFDYQRGNSKDSLFFMCISMTVLVASLSKTSMSLFVISVLLSSFLYVSTFNIKDKLFNFKVKVLTVVTVIALFGYSVSFHNEILDYLYYNLDEEFMTGRGMLWLTMLLHAENDILVGFGFNSVWGKGDFSEIYYTDLFRYNPLWVESLAASDGGYIDILVSLGLVGFFIFLFFILSVFQDLISHKKSPYFKPLFAFFFFAFCHNISESTYLLSTNVLWFVAILTSCLTLSLYQNRQGGMHV